MGDTRKKKPQGQRKSHTKKIHRSFCSIPIYPLPKKFSYSHWKKVGTDFYGAVNETWLESHTIPEDENNFGISEEVEECVLEASKSLLRELRFEAKTPEEKMLQTLAKSGLDSRSQVRNLEYLQEHLNALKCISRKEDVVKAFALLSKHRFKSILNFQFHIDPQGKLQLCLDCDMPGLKEGLYTDSEKMKQYVSYLKELGEKFRIPGLEKVFKMERDLVYLTYSMWSPIKTKSTGNGLIRKFPGFPWKLWFESQELEGWRTKTIYYGCPRWIRKISTLLDRVSIDWWRLYLSRCFIVNMCMYLPPPYDEIDFRFFGKVLQGQKKKLPQMKLMINVMHNYCTDIFSELFWKRYGDESLVSSVKTFTQKIIEAAQRKLGDARWLSKKSQEKAIQKIQNILVEVVRPEQWPTHTNLPLTPSCLLQNIFYLGEDHTRTMIKRSGHPYRFWEEGVFKVNAFYYSENNEIMIPYASCVSPFYDQKAPLGWNFGGLGCIIGHEICHGFDEDGKEFGPTGQRKQWWTAADKRAYTKLANKLIAFYGDTKVEGKRLSGKRTLSENLADLCGMSIALEALKKELEGLNEAESKEAYRQFFAAYAVSWRTLYRKEKLKSALLIDNHSPAHLRVNCVVPHFREWYDAFDISEDSCLWLDPKDRIKVI